MAKTILIVDDDSNFCKFLAEFLKLKGFQVEVFHAAEPALEEVRTKHYDLALIDIMLPGMTGIEFCQHYRSLHLQNEMKIMLMTAFSQEAEQLKESRESLGFIDCLFKPFTLPELHRRINTLLDLTPTGESQPAIEVKGSLAETSFAKLLNNLYTLKSTGLLQVERANLKKVIYIKAGYPIFARSNLVKECLGQMLVEQGLISAEQCQASLELVKQKGRLQGTVLIEMGLLTPHQLHDELRRQVTEKLLEVFAWTDGSYQFIQGKDFKKGVTGIDLSPAALIYQGIRRHYSAARLNRVLAPFRKRFLMQSENPHYRFQDIGFTSRDEKIYALCRGNLTLEEIVGRYPLAKTDTEQLLAALLISEMLDNREVAVDPSIQDDETLLSPDAQKLRKQLLEDYSHMIQQDYFSLLGVSPQDSKAKMRKVYFALAKQYHPDRFLQHGLSEELKVKLNELFQRIGEAYETVSNPTSCKAYQEKLKNKGNPKPPRLQDILRAETAFQKGRNLLRSNHYAEAYRQLKIAFDISPEEPEYMTPYAYALLKTDPGKPTVREQAKQILRQSALLNNELDLTHLYLGYLLKLEGREKEAEKRFELALQCNPDCTEALRELRLSNLRKESEKKLKAKGLFDKMFRKPTE